MVSHFCTCFIIYNRLIIADNDFNKTTLIAAIPADATSTKVTVAVTKDDIVEEDETFNIILNVPSSLAPKVVPGSITSSIGTIIDTTGKHKTKILPG